MILKNTIINSLFIININNLHEEALKWFLSLHILNKGTYYTPFYRLCITGQFDKVNVFDKHYDFKNKILRNEYCINFFYMPIMSG